MLVRIFKSYLDTTLFRQTPGRSGIWRGVKFVDGRQSGPCDCAVIHSKSVGLRWVKCPADRVWLMQREPPNEHHRHWNFAPRSVAAIYTVDPTIKSPRHRALTPMTPWHVGRDYDFLKSCPPPEKTRTLSWITSDLNNSDGHRLRMRYLEQIREVPELELFGRGFKTIDDKWDALASHRYSIAFESYSNSIYFTEKVMDCFLAWTMPVYFGCTELERYFPAESFVRVDPHAENPRARLREILRSDRRERNLDAIAEARRLVLDKYNFFEQIVSEMEAHPPQRRVRRTLIYDHTAKRSKVVTNIFHRAVDRLQRSIRPAPRPSDEHDPSHGVRTMA